MSDERHHLDDEELRRTIRAEIERRDSERREERRRKVTQQATSALSEKKRQVYREELHRYYQDRPGYREVVSEDGEVDWIPEDEAYENDELFDDVLEDPYEARKWQKVIFVFTILLVGAITLTLYFLLHEGKGTIQVFCNVPQARVILDATPTDHYTNAKIEELPAGEHFITIEKPGYRIDGETVQKVNLKEGENKVITFTLVRLDESEEGSGSSVQRSAGNRMGS